jgi:hypothetical protein
VGHTVVFQVVAEASAVALAAEEVSAVSEAEVLVAAEQVEAGRKRLIK